MTRVLVLRPEPGASATVAKARERGLDAVAAPLFEIEPVAWEAPEAGSFDGLLLTSATAVRCAGEQLEKLRGLKVYAVGDATAEAARDAGFDIASTGDSGVDRLLGSIEADLKLLHLSGEDRREPDKARQSIRPLPVYRSRPVDSPNIPLEGETVALIHSPRAAERFAELVKERTSVSIAAISRAAADSVGGGWKSMAAADQPTDDALLALAASLCNNSPPE